MSKAVVKFAIIGCGMISNWHAQAVNEIKDAELVGVTDVYEPARIAFAEKYGVRAFESVEALLAEPEIDVVCICTPSGLHAPLAISCANAGKSIVVEKPMAITREEIAGILEACERNHVKMSVISQMRFAPGIQAARKAVEDGVMGKIVVADLNMKFFRSQEYYDKGGWRGTWKMDGGGALMNQGIHGIDMLQYIMNSPVKAVSARTRTLVRNIEVEDTAVAILEFENGALGQIVGTTSVTPGYARTIEICGDKGSIMLEEDTIIKWDIEGVPAPDCFRPEGREGNGSANDPSAFSIQGHVNQLTDMVDAIKNDRMPMINQFDGAKPVEIILSIYESSNDGKIVEM